MKINWDKKYNTIAVYAFIVVSLSIIFYSVISSEFYFKVLRRKNVKSKRIQ